MVLSCTQMFNQYTSCTTQRNPPQQDFSKLQAA
nr:MAG TPA: hypothetical protein [Caudoviricetes sp.]